MAIKAVSAMRIEFLANWNSQLAPSQEIAFVPARVLLQDFTGVPAIVDLAAMRDAMSHWAVLQTKSIHSLLSSW